jgi:hypothetical protein
VSGWVRVLVFAFVGVAIALAVVFATKGDLKAATGALVVGTLLAPLLLEAWCPGKYVLRKPTDGSPDNLLGRMKQFRIDHPGTDGTLIIGALAILALALLASSLAGLV